MKLSREAKSYIAIILIVTISFSSGLVPLPRNYTLIHAQEEESTSPNPLVKYPPVCELRPTSYEHPALASSTYKACLHLKKMYDAALREWFAGKELVKFTDILKYGNPFLNCYTQCGLGFGGQPIFTYYIDVLKIAAAIASGGTTFWVDLASQAGQKIYDAVNDIANIVAKLNCLTPLILGKKEGGSEDSALKDAIVDMLSGSPATRTGGLLGQCGILDQGLHIYHELRDCVGPYLASIDWADWGSEDPDSPTGKFAQLLNFLNDIQSLASTTATILQDSKNIDTKLQDIDNNLTSLSLNATESASTTKDVAKLLSGITSITSTPLENISSTAQEIINCAGGSSSVLQPQNKIFCSLSGSASSPKEMLGLREPTEPPATCKKSNIENSANNIKRDINNFLDKNKEKIDYLISKREEITSTAAESLESLISAIGDILTTSTSLYSSTTDLEANILSEAKDIKDNSEDCTECSDGESITDKAKRIKDKMNSFSATTSNIALSSQELNSIPLYKIKASGIEPLVKPLRGEVQTTSQDYAFLQSSFLEFHKGEGGEHSPTCTEEELKKAGGWPPDLYAQHNCDNALEAVSLSGTCVTSSVATTIDCFLGKMERIENSVNELSEKINSLLSSVPSEKNEIKDNLKEEINNVTSSISNIKNITQGSLRETLNNIAEVIKEFDVAVTAWDLINRLIIPPSFSLDVGFTKFTYTNKNNLVFEINQLIASSTECLNSTSGWPNIDFTSSLEKGEKTTSPAPTNPSLFKCTAGECTNYKGGKTIFPDLSAALNIIEGAHKTILNQYGKISRLKKEVSEESGQEVANEIWDYAQKLGGGFSPDFWSRWISEIVVREASQAKCGKSLCAGYFCFTGIPALCNWFPNLWHILMVYFLHYPLESATDYLGNFLSSPQF